MSDLLGEKISFDNKDAGIKEVNQRPERHPDGTKVKEKNQNKINIGDVDMCGKYEFI